MHRSAISDADNLWRPPVPYVLDKSLGKYECSCIITQNIACAREEHTCEMCHPSGCTV